MLAFVRLDSWTTASEGEVPLTSLAPEEVVVMANGVILRGIRSTVLRKALDKI
jgi:hypothetical protein